MGYGGIADFGSGLLRGIMLAAEQRRQQKQDILKAIMTDPEAAMTAYGDKAINTVSTVPRVQDMINTKNQRRDTENEMRLAPEVAGGIDPNQPLTAQNIQQASSKAVTYNRNTAEQQKTFDNRATTMRLLNDNPAVGRAIPIAAQQLSKERGTAVKADPFDTEVLTRAQDIAYQEQNTKSDSDMQKQAAFALYQNVLKINPNKARGIKNPFDMNQVLPHANNLEMHMEIVKDAGTGTSYFITKDNSGTILDVKASGFTYPYNGGSGQHEATPQSMPYVDPASGWKIALKGNTPTGLPQYVVVPNEAKPTPTGDGRYIVGNKAYKYMESHPEFSGYTEGVGTKYISMSMYDAEYQKAQSGVNSLKVNAGTRNLREAVDLPDETRKTLNQIDPEGQWLNDDKKLTKSDFQRVNNKVKRMYYPESKAAYGGGTAGATPNPGSANKSSVPGLIQ